MREIKIATDEEIAEIEAMYAKTPNTSWDFSIVECMELIARIRKVEAQRDEAMLALEAVSATAAFNHEFNRYMVEPHAIEMVDAVIKGGK